VEYGSLSFPIAMNRKPRGHSISSALIVLVVVLSTSGCGGKSRARPGVGDQADGSSDMVDPVTLYDLAETSCEQLQQVSCGTPGAKGACMVNGRNLVGDAQQNECTRAARDALTCTAGKLPICNEGSEPRIASECVELFDAFNNCVARSHNGASLGCGAMVTPEPEENAGCEVSCGVLKASCSAHAGTYSCTCTNGAQQAVTFEASDCPNSRQLVENCQYDTLF
jgi:hypothetical protein